MRRLSVLEQEQGSNYAKARQAEESLAKSTEVHTKIIRDLESKNAELSVELVGRHYHSGCFSTFPLVFIAAEMPLTVHATHPSILARPLLPATSHHFLRSSAFADVWRNRSLLYKPACTRRGRTRAVLKGIARNSWTRRRVFERATNGHCAASTC